MPRKFKGLHSAQRNQLRLGSMLAKYPGRFPRAASISFSKLLNIRRK